MSESSQSLHLWRAGALQTMQLALVAGVIGRVVASNERWTTFVPLEDDEVTKLALALPALSLHWTYFEDFGLGLVFFQNGEELGRLDVGWQGEPVVPAPTKLLEILRSKGVVDSFGPIEELSYAVARGTCPPRTARDCAAALLGLPAYEWLSPGYCRDTPLEEMRRVFPDVQDIGEEK